jgi:hypothetical protein
MPEQKQFSLDIDDAETTNKRHQAEISRQMLRDYADNKINMDEFRERAKNLTVGKPGKEAQSAKESLTVGDSFKVKGLSKDLHAYDTRGKGGGSSSSGGGGKAGANPVKTGSLSPFNMKKGGKVSSASKRADGCAIRGKTRA